MYLLNKRILLGLSFFLVIQLFGQESKIENYKRWKYVSELLTAMQDSGVVLLRLQDFENSKNYIRKNYDKSTYRLYVKKVEKYNEALKRDISKGFTFSKVYVFNSKLSKHVLNDEIEKIEFLDPKTNVVKHVTQDIPHVFAQIKDLKLAGNSNPLNFSSQRLIQILDRDLQQDKQIDLQEDFFYYDKTKGNTPQSHIFEAAQKMSDNFRQLLVTANKKRKRLKRQIQSKHDVQIKDYQKKIDTMLEIKKGQITNQHRDRLNTEIEKYRKRISDIRKLEKELFDLLEA